MKTARFFAMAFVAVASLPLMAQQVSANGEQESSVHTADTQTSDSTHAHASANAGSGGVHVNGSVGDTSNINATQGPMGFGDEAASHAYEMTSVTGELQGKLDSKTAKVGDRVVLKTTERVHTADGTVIPKGTRLMGHVTQVQTRDSAHAVSQIGIAFDRAELKNGQNIAVHTLIRGVNPSPGVMAMNSMNSDGSMGAMGEPEMGGAPMGSGRGGRAGGGLLSTGGTVTTGVLERTSETTSSVSERAGAEGNGNSEGVVQLAGHGDLHENTGAHQQAAARAIPHPTAIPGVMLAGNSFASGVFSASKKDIRFESGTEMQLGIVANQ